MTMQRPRDGAGVRRAAIILAVDGVLDASLGVAVDVLRSADRVCRALGREPAFNVKVVSLRREVRLGSGMRLRTEGLLRDVERPSIVLVPGMNVVTAKELDEALGAPSAQEAARWLARASAEGALIAAGCSAVSLVAQSGLLEGKRATTMWAHGAAFRQRFPGVELDLERTTICEGRVWTAGAALSIADLALALVRRFAGPEVAEQCLRYLALDTRPTQARYFVLDHVARSSPELVRAEAWARKRLHQSFSIDELARAAGTSPRTFARRVRQALGAGPLRFVQRLRVEQAEQLLATSSLSFSEVCERVGYRDPSALRRLLQRETGKTARTLRAEAAHRRG